MSVLFPVSCMFCRVKTSVVCCIGVCSSVACGPEGRWCRLIRVSPCCYGPRYGAMGHDHTAWEQELALLPKTTSYIQKAKALLAWKYPHLWVQKGARAVGVLWRAMPGQGSPVWCSSHQMVCRVCVLMLAILFCALIFLQGNYLFNASTA